MSPQRFRFVILEKDRFVANDMQEGLRAATPDCDTRHLLHPEDAGEAFSESAHEASSRTVLVTKLSVEQIDASGLSRLAQQSCADIVVRMGDDPLHAVTERGWFSLASPFTWDDLSALVADLTRRSTAA